jgi:hypothetical protein
MSTTNHPERPQSRLDKELDEILEQSRNRPISFQERVAQKRTAIQVQKQSQVGRARSIGSGPLRTAGSWALRVPLVTAIVVALIAVWLAPEYTLISTLLGLVAAALIFAPFAMRRPSDEVVYQKRWRGRAIGPPRATTGFRGMIDSARDRFQR